MKTARNILIAFLLNLSFSIFEFFGGIITGSIAIISDSIHDIGDAISIGISYFLEKKSQKQPDQIYTYGYTRYSVIGSVITTLILLIGSVIIIYNAICRIISPVPLNCKGMILFAIIGVLVNLGAAIATRDGESLNQKAVNLHMLEDVLGWIVILLGAIMMHFTNFSLLDPILSIGVAVYIFWNALNNLKEALVLFLEKVPDGISICEIKDHIRQLDGVLDVHHIHIRSIDGIHNCATMHIVTNADFQIIKQAVRQELREHGIDHITLELEAEDEQCESKQCDLEMCKHSGHHHHHHHH